MKPKWPKRDSQNQLKSTKRIVQYNKTNLLSVNFIYAEVDYEF